MLSCRPLSKCHQSDRLHSITCTLSSQRLGRRTPFLLKLWLLPQQVVPHINTRILEARCKADFQWLCFEGGLTMKQDSACSWHGHYMLALCPVQMDQGESSKRPEY